MAHQKLRMQGLKPVRATRIQGDPKSVDAESLNKLTQMYVDARLAYEKSKKPTKKAAPAKNAAKPTENENVDKSESTATIPKNSQKRAAPVDQPEENQPASKKRRANTKKPTVTATAEQPRVASASALEQANSKSDEPMNRSIRITVTVTPTSAVIRRRQRLQARMKNRSWQVDGNASVAGTSIRLRPTGPKSAARRPLTFAE